METQTAFLKTASDGSQFAFSFFVSRKELGKKSKGWENKESVKHVDLPEIFI